jgi:hypothetical protein
MFVKKDGSGKPTRMKGNKWKEGRKHTFSRERSLLSDLCDLLLRTRSAAMRGRGTSLYM